jgi:hypothetical protein
MVTGRVVAKYLAAVAIGTSTGGAIAYGAEHFRPDRTSVSVQTAGAAPATTSRLAAWLKPAADVLR